MTKTGISEKLRHYSTLFAASLFALVCLCPSIAFSDGTCRLEQDDDGTFRIFCEGDRIEYIYEVRTNNIYVVKNCEELKSQLYAVASSQHSVVENVRDDYIVEAQGVIMSGQSDVDSLEGESGIMVQSAWSYLGSLLSTSYQSLDFVSESQEELIDTISAIECGSCSTNISGGSCCNVDLTPILDRLNSSNRMLSLVTNTLYGTFGTRNFNPFVSLPSNPGGKLLSPVNDTFQYFGAGLHDNNILNNLNIINSNLAGALRSVNNYLYKIGFMDLPSISNNVEHLYIDSTNFFSVATNHFSFFREMSIQDSPLIDYSASPFYNYYDFLTNHYVKVSLKDYGGLVGDEKAKTNWFSRIETLIASLVFADSVESTNTVDSARAESESSSILSETFDGVSDVKNASSSQLSVFRDTSQNVVSSLRSISDSFSSAADPGTVRLFSLPSDSLVPGPSISFETSEIRNLVEACHCATTLCWCFVGLLMLYSFLHWTVKTSYSLVMFAWGVFSAIFKH